MVRSAFSMAWKNSTQVRKQRKYRFNAPLHVQQKFVHVHLSKDLREKYGKRRIQVKTGDKVMVMRGTHKKKEGSVEKVELKNTKIFVTGIDVAKKDGSSVLVALAPSNLMITVLNTKDSKRRLEAKKVEKKTVEAKQ
jgi:large subunit ribosomal protein L24